jgi:limonene 1,2-monooxygenase
MFEVAVAAVASPTGPSLAGRHGLGLLSIGATLTADGFDALAHHWNVMEERAATYGTTVEGAAWRLVGVMHVAETREQAVRDVEYGICVIGTVEDAKAQVRRLLDQSGGFGAMLLMAHDWANPAERGSAYFFSGRDSASARRRASSSRSRVIWASSCCSSMMRRMAGSVMPWSIIVTTSWTRPISWRL